MRRKIRLTALLCALAFMLTSCRQASPPDESSGNNDVYTETSVCETSAVIEEVTSAEPEAPSDTTVTTTASAETESGETPAETGGDTEAPETSSESESESAASESVSEAPAVTTAAPPQTTSATTTAYVPPAEIIIPKIKNVSSPGEKVLNGDNAIVDYSNASSGYISAKYTGKSARAKIQLVTSKGKNVHDLSVGGVTEYFPLSLGSGEYQIQVFEQVSGKAYANVLDETVRLTVTDDVNMYVYPNKYVSFGQDSASVKKSAEVCAGKEGSIEKLAAIFVFITSNVTYDAQLAATVQSGYVPDPDSVLSKKKGICFDYASLFAAMARAQGIPTRLVIGYASPDIYHAWNEVWTKETGWITVELFLKNSGYNLLDATFYSGAADKEKIAAYISDTKNYSPLYMY